MNNSKGLRQKLLKNRIKFNNMMLNIKNRKNQKNDVRSLKKIY